MSTSRLLFALLIPVCLGCGPEVWCPTPTPDRVKKASIKHMKLYKHQRQEYLLARAKEKEYAELIQSQQRKQKIIDPQIWDCPKPGSAHARQLEKHRKKLDAWNAKQLKKKESSAQFAAGD